ncbi:MAG: HAMP domain-containing histidine kinase [Pseudomonadales bacterium]|nr:HAMP domain-containing histidine kinase [Pseudomonadales bacterium]
MNPTETDYFEEQHSLQRTTILRVYNYYRILIAFLFLFLFLDEDFNEFVGTVNPELFQVTILGYIIANVLIGLATLFIRTEMLAKPTPSFVILTADIIALTLLMSASGGVSSGLGNFLIFTVAFGGGLIQGRVSTVLPAIAFILTLDDEFYLFFLDINDEQSFFQAGILGIVYFVANILFQTLARKLRSRETEVFTLEQINRIIVEKLYTGVAVASSDGEIKLINQAGRNFLKRPSTSGPTVSELPQSLIEKMKSWREDPYQGAVSFYTHDSGPELLANFSVLTTPDANSDTLIFIEDSTEAQRQAQQLKLAGLGRLSASIAHEIRNPLGAISHAAQLLKESQNLDKGDKRLTEIVQDHCLRMNDVIENVLQMSRRKTAEPKPLLLSEWLPRFIDEFKAGLHEQASIEVSLDPPNISVEVDPLHLSQALGNLCQNGLRYSEKQTGERKLNLNGGIDTGSGFPFLEVIDYGPGVDKDQESNLFEPFFTTEATGTGLGLYLSKELCEANNARLSYRHAPEGGGCFRITFFQDSRY